MPSLKARITHCTFVVSVFDKEKNTEGVMKVENVKSNDDLEVLIYAFCTEDTLRSMHQYQISNSGTKET